MISEQISRAINTTQAKSYGVFRGLLSVTVAMATGYREVHLYGLFLIVYIVNSYKLIIPRQAVEILRFAKKYQLYSLNFRFSGQ